MTALTHPLGTAGVSMNPTRQAIEAPGTSGSLGEEYPVKELTFEDVHLPFVSGDINTVWTGVCYGMKMYELYPPGLPIVVIPWHHIDRVLRNTKEMPWTLPGHSEN